MTGNTLKTFLSRDTECTIQYTSICTRPSSHVSRLQLTTAELCGWGLCMDLIHHTTNEELSNNEDAPSAIKKYNKRRKDCWWTTIRGFIRWHPSWRHHSTINLVNQPRWMMPIIIRRCCFSFLQYVQYGSMNPTRQNSSLPRNASFNPMSTTRQKEEKRHNYVNNQTNL